ncbi:hypothetical protein SAMN05660653_02008 [Desulfonatronum thiosulfatophilum]|uniref:Clp protease n=2 Tax=Desulfonatronum thiosulfatophilum TaxID=617002 RepID=A0A1G6DAM7_9BACT|nr:hypothetical protein SAMN05660653_02008 [Desulfonatronum thiosulfatophilum]
MRSILTMGLILIVLSQTQVFGRSVYDPSAEEAYISVEGTTATFAGSISDLNVTKFLDSVEGRVVETLVIASGGGEINAGMRLGEWVFDNQADVVVEKMCMSSCANYVFTAGRRKIINANAIVGWHGNALQKRGITDADVRAELIQAYEQLDEQAKNKLDLEGMLAQAIQQTREYMENSKAKQARFFEKIDVDEYICRVGNEEYGVRDFFLLSVEDMAKFGVRDVLAPDDYELTDLEPYRRMGKGVEFIRLISSEAVSRMIR